MGSAAILKDAGAVQKVMDQRIDGDHAFAGLEPMRAAIRGPKQQPGEGHGEDLVGDAVDIAEGPDQPLLALSGEIHMGGDRSSGRNGQAVVDPADQVAVGNVADKEKEAVGGLIEATVAEPMTRHRAGIDVVGFGASEADLVVSTAVKVPIGAKQRAGWRGVETRCNVRPGCIAMFSNVAASHLVGDALIAERAEKPIRNSRCVVIGDGLNDTGFPNVSPDVIEKCQRSRQATDPSDQIDRAIIVARVQCRGQRRSDLWQTFASACELGSVSDQRYQPPLGVTVAIDVPLRGLNRAMTGQQLDVTQRATRLVNQPCCPSDECPATRM